MSVSREREVTAAFVALASNLANGHDVVELLNDLTDESARLLDVEAAGLLLADGFGVLHVLAASSERLRQLQELQLEWTEGPCLDCFSSGVPVAAADLNLKPCRWPQFAPAARAAGFVSVHTVPLRRGEHVLGTLGLFGAAPGCLNAADLALAQAMADVAGVSLVQDRSLADQGAVIEQLQRALTSRVVLEQAKGMLAQSAGLDMTAAFGVLRRYARDHNLRLEITAMGIVSRSLPVPQVMTHARSIGLTG